MRLASFNLNGNFQAGYDAGAEIALRKVTGVTDVLIGDPNDTCSVVYDEHTVTAARLREALADAGYASLLVTPAPQASTCCGSCGG